MIGGIAGAILTFLSILTLTAVLAAPTAPPPDGNPPYPAAGPPGPPGANGTDGISGFRLVSRLVDGNTFAAGITVSCATDEYLVGCSHTCTAGIQDTLSWPIDNRTCRGYESNNNTHGGNCTLIAHCLKHD